MGGTLGGSSGGVMGRKGLRVDTADSIGPTAVMLDDLIVTLFMLRSFPTWQYNAR